MNIILQGTVGSTAYGLNHPLSDIDTLGTFIYPARKYFQLSDPEDSVVTKNPDTTMHEIRKYLNLALKCNPTVTELMWLNDYNVVSEFGERLIGMRTKFLSEKFVREAYLGYAKSQLIRLQDRDDKRAPKHAMHMARLVNQGAELYTRGELTIKVKDPEWYIDFKRRDPSYWIQWYYQADKIFRASKCYLPEYPDAELVEDYLYNIRKAYS